MKVYIIFKEFEIFPLQNEIIGIYKTKVKATKKCNKLNLNLKSSIFKIAFIVKEFEVK